MKAESFKKLRELLEKVSPEFRDTNDVLDKDCIDVSLYKKLQQAKKDLVGELHTITKLAEDDLSACLSPQGFPICIKSNDCYSRFDCSLCGKSDRAGAYILSIDTDAVAVAESCCPYLCRDCSERFAPELLKQCDKLEEKLVEKLIALECEKEN